MFQRYIEKNILSYISDENYEIEALVLKRLYAYSSESCFEIKCKKINGEPVNINMILTCEYSSDVQKGFLICTDVVFSDFENSDSFDEKSYYRTRNFYMRATEQKESYTVLDENVTNLSLTIKNINSMLGEGFSSAMKSESAALYRAVFLGDKADLPDNVERDFRRTGTYHLLALSGMHLAVISSFVEKALKRMSARKGVRYAVLPIILALYTIISGMSLSVVRSAIMLCASYLAYFLRAKMDKLTSLCFSGALICAVSPNSVSDIGLWLSFFATFGILIYDNYKSYIFVFILKRINNMRIRTLLRKSISELCVSFSALLMTLPFTWITFGKISWVGPIVTFILSPLVSLMLTISPLYLVFSITSFKEFAAFLPEKLAELTMWIVKSFSYIHGVSVSINYSFVPYLILPFILIFLILLVVKIQRKYFIPLTALLFVFVFSVIEIIALNKNVTELTYYQDKNNEYFSVFDKGRHVLIDISDGSYSKMKKSLTDEVKYGYDELDVLILTHVHKKHVSSVSKLISREMVYEVWLPSPQSETERTTVLSIADMAEKAGAKVVIYKTGGKMLLFDKINLKIDRAYLSRSTHPVNALEFYGNINALYIGSSYFDYSLEVADSENIFYGTHGPVCKNEYNICVTDRTKLVSIADEELLSLAVSDSDFDGIHLYKNTKKLKFIKEY